MTSTRRLIFIFQKIVIILLTPALLINLYLNFTYLVLLKDNSTVLDFHPSFLRQAQDRLFILHPFTYPSTTARLAEAEGRVALFSGNAEEAITHLTRAVASGRASEMTHWYLGEAFSRVGHQEAALLQWREAHAAPYFLQLGLALRHQKDWSRAEPALQTAAFIDPTNANLYHSLAQFYWEWGKPDAAIPHLQRALMFETDLYEQLLLRGEIAQLEGQRAEAESHFMAAMRVKPARPEAYQRLAAMLEALDEPQEAITVLTAGLQRTSPALGLYLQLGQLLTQQKRFAEADQVYQQAEHVDPFSDDPLVLRAQNAIAWGRDADAEQHLQQALKLTLDNPDTHFWLAELKARQGHCAEARAEYALAAQLAPNDERYQPPVTALLNCQ